MCLGEETKEVLEEGWWRGQWGLNHPSCVRSVVFKKTTLVALDAGLRKDERHVKCLFIADCQVLVIKKH